MLRSKWPTYLRWFNHLNQKLSQWWVFGLLGVCLGVVISYGFAILIPEIFDSFLSSGIANSEMDAQKKIDFLLEQEVFMREAFVRIMKRFGLLFAGVVTLLFFFVGLILEERKGCRRVVEKLQSKSQKTDPNQSDNEGT